MNIHTKAEVSPATALLQHIDQLLKAGVSPSEVISRFESDSRYEIIGDGIYGVAIRFGTSVKVTVHHPAL